MASFKDNYMKFADRYIEISSVNYIQEKGNRYTVYCGDDVFFNLNKNEYNVPQLINKYNLNLSLLSVPYFSKDQIMWRKVWLSPEAILQIKTEPQIIEGDFDNDKSTEPTTYNLYEVVMSATGHALLTDKTPDEIFSAIDRWQAAVDKEMANGKKAGVPDNV